MLSRPKYVGVFWTDISPPQTFGIICASSTQTTNRNATEEHANIYKFYIYIYICIIYSTTDERCFVLSSCKCVRILTTSYFKILAYKSSNCLCNCNKTTKSSMVTQGLCDLPAQLTCLSVSFSDTCNTENFRTGRTKALKCKLCTLEHCCLLLLCDRCVCVCVFHYHFVEFRFNIYFMQKVLRISWQIMLPDLRAAAAVICKFSSGKLLFKRLQVSWRRLRWCYLNAIKEYTSIQVYGCKPMLGIGVVFYLWKSYCV